MLMVLNSLYCHLTNGPYYSTNAVSNTFPLVQNLGKNTFELGGIVLNRFIPSFFFHYNILTLNYKL